MLPQQCSSNYPRRTGEKVAGAIDTQPPIIAVYAIMLVRYGTKVVLSFRQEARRTMPESGSSYRNVPQAAALLFVALIVQAQVGLEMHRSCFFVRRFRKHILRSIHTATHVADESLVE